MGRYYIAKRVGVHHYPRTLSVANRMVGANLVRGYATRTEAERICRKCDGYRVYTVAELRLAMAANAQTAGEFYRAEADRLRAAGFTPEVLGHIVPTGNILLRDAEKAVAEYSDPRFLDQWIERNTDAIGA